MEERARQDWPALHASIAGKEAFMLLFIKQNQIHQYPVAKGCNAVYQQEPLRDTIPHDVKRCPYCLGLWPGMKE